jgi:hypothetical protein
VLFACQWEGCFRERQIWEYREDGNPPPGWVTLEPGGITFCSAACRQRYVDQTMHG